jgi:osmotically-inducible protein OsmY
MTWDAPAARLTLILLLAALLSGCGVAVIGGVATGAAVAHDRRTAGTVVEDKNISLKSVQIREDHPQLSQKLNVSVTSYNLQVLITGQASDAQSARRFAELVAEIPRVRRVFNEVEVAAEGTWTEAAHDAYLTNKAKLALFGVKLENFDPTRVKVVTSQDTVYLMGLLTRAEAEAVTNEVRLVNGVKRVVKLFEYLESLT